MFTIWFLIAGILVYTCIELMRVHGKKIPFITALTVLASRPREQGRFVFGPVTLGLGGLAAIVFFPPQTAAIAIYALAFGDGLASLAGLTIGRIRPAFMCGKSLEGSFACFAAVFLITLKVSGSLVTGLAAALAATVAEALPLHDFDNIAVPLATAIAVAIAVSLI